MSTSGAGRRTRRGSWLLIAPALTSLAWAGNHFTPLLPMYRLELGYSPVQADLFLAMQVVGIIPGFLLAGPAVRRFGVRSTLLGVMPLSVTGSVVLMLASTSATGLCLGRAIIGMTSGLGIVAASAWLQQLSAAMGSAATARRVGLALTLGFVAGPLASGALATWAPHPAHVPFLIHVVLGMLAGAIAAAASPPGTAHRAPRVRLTPEAARRYALVIAPAAPWVCAAPAFAGAVAPAMLEGATSQPVFLATLLIATVLGCGAISQAAFPRLHHRARGHHISIGLCLIAIGTLSLAADVAPASVGAAFGAAVLLGLGQGIGLVGGLAEVQDISPAAALPVMTAVFYALTYIGFTTPFAVSAVGSWWSVDTVLYGLAAAALLTAAYVAGATQRVRVTSTAGRSSAHPSRPVKDYDRGGPVGGAPR